MDTLESGPTGMVSPDDEAARDALVGRLFEAGWRGSAARTPGADGGAGLGLAVVRGLVDAVHGDVSVHNVDGGCSFDLTLPTRAPA